MTIAVYIWEGAHSGRPERDPGEYAGRHRACTCSTMFVHWRRKCHGPLATMVVGALAVGDWAAWRDRRTVTR